MSNRLVDAVSLARSFGAQNAEFLAHRKGAAGTEPAVAIYIHETDGPTNLREIVSMHAARSRGLGVYPVKIVEVPAFHAQVVVGEDGILKSPERDMRCLFTSYPDRAVIRVLGSLNSCWTRFVLCKEMAHLIMGRGDGLRTTQMETQLRMALSIYLDEPEGELSAEEFAWFVAAELMVPFAERRDWQPHNDGRALAERYLCPKVIIDLLKSEHYGEITHRVG